MPDLVLVQQTLAAGLGDEAGHLVGGEARGDLVAGLGLEDVADHEVRGLVHQPDERAEDQHEDPQDRAQQQGRGGRAGDGHVLGDHLADHHVEERDDQQGDDQPHEKQPHPDGLAQEFA